jgi:hypothetical protein
MAFSNGKKYGQPICTERRGACKKVRTEVVAVGAQLIEEIGMVVPGIETTFVRTRGAKSTIGGHHGMRPWDLGWADRRSRIRERMGLQDIMEQSCDLPEHIVSESVALEPITRMFKRGKVMVPVQFEAGTSEEEIAEIMAIANSNSPVRNPEPWDYFEDGDQIYETISSDEFDDYPYFEESTLVDWLGFDPMPQVAEFEILRTDRAARVKADLYDPERTGSEDGFVLDDDTFGGVGTTVRKEHNLGAIGASYYGRTTRSAIA